MSLRIWHLWSRLYLLFHIRNTVIICNYYDIFSLTFNMSSDQGFCFSRVFGLLQITSLYIEQCLARLLTSLVSLGRRTVDQALNNIFSVRMCPSWRRESLYCYHVSGTITQSYLSSSWCSGGIFHICKSRTDVNQMDNIYLLQPYGT